MYASSFFRFPFNNVCTGVKTPQYLDEPKVESSNKLKWEQDIETEYGCEDKEFMQKGGRETMDEATDEEGEQMKEGSDIHHCNKNDDKVCTGVKIQYCADEPKVESFKKFNREGDVEIGDVVIINGNHEVPGVVKYIGYTHFAKGIWIGIKIPEAIGLNDGSIGEYRYFNAPHKCGVFAPPERVTVVKKASDNIYGGSDIEEEVESEKGNNTCCDDTENDVSMNSDVGIQNFLNEPKAESSMEYSEEEKNSDVEIGDVVIINGNHKVPGVVKYIGYTHFAKGTWIGIKIPKAIGLNDGSIGEYRYFNAPYKCGVFAPPERVTIVKKASDKDKVFINKNGSTTVNELKLEGKSEKGRGIHRSRQGIFKVYNDFETRLESSKKYIENVEDLNNPNVEIGDVVIINGNHEVPGVVKYIRYTHFAKGIWIGIKIPKAIGLNDGSIGEYRYFSAPYKCGVFAPPERVTVVAKAAGSGNGKDKEYNVESVRKKRKQKYNKPLQMNRGINSDITSNTQKLLR